MRAWITSIVVAFLLGGSGCGPEVRTGVVLSLRGDPVAGERLWDEHCASCHGDEGKGSDAGPAIDGAVASDEQLVDRILGGSLLMPAFRDELSDQAVADVLAWLREGLRIAAQ